MIRSAGLRHGEVLLLSASFALTLVGCNGTQAKKMEGPKLDCWLDGDALHLRLTNRSKDPIVIDGELVFGVNVQFWGLNGMRVETEEVGRAERSTKAILKARFRTLGSGESAERVLRFSESFKVFVCGTSAGMAVTAYEGLDMAPDRKKVDSVIVRYGPVYAFPEGFEFYCGFRDDEIGLYLGPLQAECRFRSEPRSNKSGT